jgi:6-phospho-3-hexuloisomerase
MDPLLSDALEDVRAVLQALTSSSIEVFVSEILQARRIFCYGVGREGLMTKALCMRLMHLGLDTSYVGEMTTPPIGKGDLLILSAGPGYFSTVAGLAGVAKTAEARTMVITAQEKRAVVLNTDVIIEIDAPTMADNLERKSGALPMGSIFEGAEYFFFEVAILKLRDKIGENADSMAARHTNLE